MGSETRIRILKSKLLFGPFELIPHTPNLLADVTTRDFSRGSWKLLSGTFSPYLAPKAYHGREKVVLAFEEYFCNFDPEAASPLMQARMTNMTDTLDIEAMARMECVNGLAILANTVPSAFWTLVQVYSHPELLQRVRELAAVAVVDVDIADEHSTITGTGTGASEAKPARKTIDLPKLQRSAPQIQYLIHETIRLHTTGIGPRLVREDVLLQDQYLLRKNSVVVIPNRAIHFDKEVWGDDVDDFRDNRFDKAQSSSLSPNAYDDGNNGEKVTRGKKAPTTAYRGFGGGATVCPGKHFAVDGIAVFVALVVSRYDIFPVYRKGWEALEQDTRDMALQLGGPVERLSVEIVRRKG